MDNFRAYFSAAVNDFIMKTLHSANLYQLKSNAQLSVGIWKKHHIILSDRNHLKLHENNLAMWHAYSVKTYIYNVKAAARRKFSRCYDTKTSPSIKIPRISKKQNYHQNS